MAVRIERRGAGFYEKAAKASTNDQVTRVFDFLLDAEKEHERVFKEMRERHGDSKIPESYPGETRSYLDSFVHDQVFDEDRDPGELGERIKDPVDAIDFAMDIEKSSILFYSGLKQVVRESEHNVIEQVIKEEHKHIRALVELKRRL
jgi:rubrerythrin